MKIRQYKPDDRNFLLNTPLPQWLEVYAAYLRDAECPFKEEELTECVDWLLGYAIRLEYSDNGWLKVQLEVKLNIVRRFNEWNY